MYAVVVSGGKQYKVSEGDTFTVDRIDAEVGSSVDLNQVLLVHGDDVAVGSPTVPGARVTVEVVRHGQGDKAVTYKYVRTRRYRKTRGFRASLTTLRVTAISA